MKDLDTDRIAAVTNGDEKHMGEHGGYLDIIDETVEMVLIFDKGGQILYCNNSALEKMDYTREELHACNMAEIFRQEFQLKDDVCLPFDMEVLAQKHESAMYRKNKTCFPVTIRFFKTPDGTDYLLAEDITWQKDMDVRIHQLKEEGEKNARIRNEFTANVTHELRTPVNGIRGHAMTLLETMDNPQQRRTVEIILNCCENMSAIINNILDFSKLEAGKFTIEETEFDFYKMMDNIIQTHLVEINKKELHLSVDIAENVPQYLIGDSLRIGQILNNLLSNSVKFTQVGQISVDVSVTSRVKDGIGLFFMIRDTGIGIAKEEQDRLFQSFQQVDGSITRRFGGTGLGLSITKQLVEMMNGTIYVESEKGRGSCFSFNIWLHTTQNEQESKDVQQTFKNWSSLMDGIAGSDEYELEDPEKEIKKRMEKLVLSLEMGLWEKAEMLAGTLKVLMENTDMKRNILRLEMAIRKADYEKSMSAYEKFAAALEEMPKGGE